MLHAHLGFHPATSVDKPGKDRVAFHLTEF